MIVQRQLFDARFACRDLFLGLSLWCEVRGKNHAAAQAADTANLIDSELLRSRGAA